MNEEDPDLSKLRVCERVACSVGVTADDHMMKVETVHCSACSVYIPAFHSSVQQHLKSPDHVKGKQVRLHLIILRSSFHTSHAVI